MKFNKLTMKSSFFSDDYKMLKNIFPLFWQNFILCEEEKLFYILVKLFLANLLFFFRYIYLMNQKMKKY